MCCRFDFDFRPSTPRPSPPAPHLRALPDVVVRHIAQQPHKLLLQRAAAAAACSDPSSAPRRRHRNANSHQREEALSLNIDSRRLLHLRS